jgi:Holliday junction resolvase
MAMTPERKVKKKVADYLRSIGAYFFYPATGGYGRSGVPDIVGCYKGKFFGIECKAGKNTATELQKNELRQITEAGGIATVTNEDTIHSLSYILNGLHEPNPDQLELDFD